MQEDRRDSEINRSFDELRDLLADFTTGDLTDEQDARLQQLVTGNEKAGRFYLQYMFLYGTIHQEYCDHDRLQMSVVPSVDCPEPPKQDPPSVPNGSIFPLLEIEDELLSSSGDTCDLQGSPKTNGLGPGFWGHINFSFVPWAITIVAGVLILSSIIILPIYWATRPLDPKWNVVARITKAVDCQWAQGETEFQENDFLTVDRLLDLEVGLVEIEFSSGTKIVLQGPARFMATGHNGLRLDSGKLAAVVPEGAEGFKVRTAGMEVVDLGTEFGIAVNANDKADVHVFKGVVEMETTKKSGDTQSICLKENEAAEYDTTSGSMVSIPVNANKFVRDINSTEGVTTKLRVVNPSFEVPDIRTVQEYQSAHGDTLFYPIHGWKVSDSNSKKIFAAKYQITPYKSPAKRIYYIAPVATDGCQVLTILLGRMGKMTNGFRCNWVYQSLGCITTADIGKTLKLSVDAGPRAKHISPQGEGAVFANFALRVTSKQLGVTVGDADSFTQEGEIKHLHRLEAVIPITVELVGQELFIVLGARDEELSMHKDDYHFDNVQVAVEK